MAWYRSSKSEEITSITPSNASPVSLTADTAVKPTTAGYAISSYNSVTPSNSSPVALASGDIDKMGGAGYAIESYSDVTPTEAGVAFSSGFNKMSAGGYACTGPMPVLGQQPDKVFQNNSGPSSGSVDITVTQKPRYILLSIWSRNSNYYGYMGVVDVVNNQAWLCGYLATGSENRAWPTYTNLFTTISDTKITFNYGAFAAVNRTQIMIFY